MGGRTSAAAKNKWISGTYDRINLTVPKGKKEILQSYASSRGESMNGLINRLISEELSKNK